MSASMNIKAMVRPLVPDRFVARYRLHQHSKQARSNVDVFVTGSRVSRRWRATTPDTYRVILGPLPWADPSPDMVVVAADEAREDDEHVAAGLAAASGGVGVVAAASRPRLAARRRSEPELDPRAIALSDAVFAEVGGLPDGDHPLRGLLTRVQDAGHRVALHPAATTVGSSARDDPVDGEAWLVLAAVPLHDIGGGSRSAQVAGELLQRGAHVTHVSLYGTQESADLGLRFVHPRLEQWGIRTFDAAALAARAAVAGTVLVEAPAPELAAAARAMRAAGWTVVYDIIDDWRDPALGGDWYSSRVEQELIAGADLVTGSADDLVGRARDAGRDAVLVPNAVNEDLFGVEATACPAELQAFPLPIIGYHGSLYGEWFDWDAVARVAGEHPAAAVVLIGDDKGHPDLPTNVHFLGLVPQRDLPPYLQHIDVGLVPFAVTGTTHAVSPLKVFEYLASGVPVAAPPLRPLTGIDGVHTDDDLVVAVAAALGGERPDRRAALRAHSWRQRVDVLYRALGRAPSVRTGPSAVSVLRPAVHYGKGERLISS